MKKFFSLMLTVAMAVSVFAMPLNADSAIVYDLNSYDPFSGRTSEEVASRYQAALDSATTDYYEVPYVNEAPYSGGRLNEETQQSMTNMLNFHRWLIGVNDNIPVSPYREDLQAGCIVRSYQFSHSVERDAMPEDMSDEFFVLGAYAPHNIIAFGYTPQGAMTGYLNEGARQVGSDGVRRFGTIGHRTMLLGYSVSGVQFGYAGGIHMGDVTASNNTMSLPFASFPAAGYCPDAIVYPTRAVWSVQLNPDILKVDDLSDVRVTVTDMNTGESYICSSVDGSLAGSSTLIFDQPNTDESRYSHSYQVEITGLRDVSTGRSATAKYRTEFFDHREFVDSPVISAVLANGVEKVIISSSVNASDVAKMLGSTVVVVTANGRTAEIPVEGEWMVDEAHSCFYCSASVSSLPAHITDSNNMLRRLELPYETAYTGRCYAENTEFDVGDSTSISLTRYWVGTNIVTLYQVPSDGTAARVRATQDSAGYNPSDSSFYLSNMTEIDSGTYIYAYRYDWDDTIYITSGYSITVGARPTPTPEPDSSSGSPGSSGATTPTPGYGGNPDYENLPAVSTEEYSIGDFVERLYTIALGRSSDPVGKQDWIDAVTFRGQTGADLARGFLYSPEFLNKNVTDEEFVRTLYRTFFDREPDTDGLNGWVNALRNGQSKQDVIEGFINSTEWANLCLLYGIRNGGTGIPSIAADPNSRTIGFCTRLYTTCLNRSADQNGLMAWARQLANQMESGTGAARGFFFSSEFINQNVSDNEYVRRLYLTFMDREPDQAGFDAWVGQLQNGASREDVFNGFAASEEFSRICASYGIIR